MSDLIQAVENAKAIARTYQSVIDLVAALGDVASVEQAAAEANAAVSAAVSKRAKAEADLSAAQQLLSDMQTRLAKAEPEAKTKANAIVQAAQEKAQSIVEAAEAKAAATRLEQQSVQASYEEQLASVQEQLSAVQATLTSLNQQKAEAQAHLNALRNVGV